MSVSGAVREEFDENSSSIQSLVAKLNQQLEKQMALLEEQGSKLADERQKFEEDRTQLKKLGSSGDTLIEVNVGGTIICAQQSTLIADGESRLTTLFGEANQQLELAKDSQGRPFLDLNPYCFQKIVDYLRMLKRSNDVDVRFPTVQPDMKVEFDEMTKYLNMSFVRPTQFTCQDFVAPNGHVQIAARDDGIAFTQPNSGHVPCISTKPFPVGTSVRLRIDALNGNNWILLGVIGSTAPNGNNSYSHASCYSWANSRQIWRGGKNQSGDNWIGFQQGDEVTLTLESTKIIMTVSRLLGQEFSLDLPTNITWYIHINLHGQGDTAVLLL